MSTQLWNQTTTHAIVMGWFHSKGNSTSPGHYHPSPNYDSDDIEIINLQIDELVREWGVRPILCWNGIASTGINGLIHRTVSMWDHHSIAFEYDILLDVGSYHYQDSYFTSDMLSAQKKLEQDLDYAVKVFQVKRIFQFGWETLTPAINWERINKLFPSVAILHRHVEGLDVPYSGGMYTWVDGGPEYHQDQLNRLLQWQVAHPGNNKLFFSGLVPRFDNRKVNEYGVPLVPDQPVWGDLKILTYDDGRLLQGYYDRTNDFINKGGKLTGQILITYNDWEEGSACEGGLSLDNIMPEAVSLVRPPFKL